MKTSAKRKIAVMSAALAVVLLGSCAVSYQDQGEQVPDWFASGILASGVGFQMLLDVPNEEGVNSRSLVSGGSEAVGARAEFTIVNATPTSVRLSSAWYDNNGRYVSSFTSDTFHRGQTILINDIGIPLFAENVQGQNTVPHYLALITGNEDARFFLFERWPGIGFPPPPGSCMTGLPLPPGTCPCLDGGRLEVIMQVQIAEEAVKLLRGAEQKYFTSIIFERFLP